MPELDRAVRFRIGGVDYELQPTLEVLTKISKHGPLKMLAHRCAQGDVELTFDIIRVGGGLDREQAGKFCRDAVHVGLDRVIPHAVELIAVFLDPDPDGYEADEGGEPGKA